MEEKNKSEMQIAREFVYYSQNAVTSGNMIKDDLMKAGRMDIAINVLISAFFLSHDVRKDVKLHLIFEGPPTPPVHILIEYDEDLAISKKDVAGLIKRILYKCPSEKGKTVKAFPGCFVEKKSFEALVDELDKSGKNVFLLDKKGTDIRDLKLNGNEVFVLGDQDGFPDSKRHLLKRIDKITVSPKMLFASQVLTIVHNEIDRKEISQ
ncbi:tRNA (pseudouridine(54)-N(1))-methyltransferase [uncultured archaeon]|nr:tRNA (pseudouridine(54)-N(1))-methyltransferase [uncultured archaeon]